MVLVICCWVLIVCCAVLVVLNFRLLCTMRFQTQVIEQQRRLIERLTGQEQQI